MLYQVRYELFFPHPSNANEDGIVAFGGDLTPNRLMLAYRHGIFPWYSKDDPILWWSPNPRFILPLEQFNFRKSLRKRMKHFTFRFDNAFSEVLQACSTAPRQGQEGTWILPEMKEAYSALHDLGCAHSVESYDEEGELVGGLYGVAVGGCFCGESMFAKTSDASKAAFATLVAHLRAWGFHFIDAQVYTEHLRSLGAFEVDRSQFLELLEEQRDRTMQASWVYSEEAMKKYLF